MQLLGNFISRPINYSFQQQLYELQWTLCWIHLLVDQNFHSAVLGHIFQGKAGPSFRTDLHRAVIQLETRQINSSEGSAQWKLSFCWICSFSWKILMKMTNEFRSSNFRFCAFLIIHRFAIYRIFFSEGFFRRNGFGFGFILKSELIRILNLFFNWKIGAIIISKMRFSMSKYVFSLAKKKTLSISHKHMKYLTNLRIPKNEKNLLLNFISK